MFRFNVRRMIPVIVVCITLALMFTAFEGWAGAPVTVKVWLPYTRDIEHEFWKGVIKDFEKENPDVQVVPEFMEGGQSFVMKLSAAIKAGEVPDIVHLGGGAAQETLVRAGVVQPVTKYVDRGKFLPNLLLPYRGSKSEWKGELFYIPFQFKYSLPAYNKEIFDKFGLKPARTREEHLALLATLKTKGVVPHMTSGPAAAALVVFWLNETITTLSGDEELFERLFYRMEENFGNPYVRQALEMWKQDAAFFGTGWETAKWSDIEAMFFQGRMGIYSGKPDLITYVESEVPGFKLGFFLPPKIDGKQPIVKGEVQGFGISTTTKYKDQAVQFIQYMTTDKVQTKLVQTFLNFPAIRSAYKEGGVVDKVSARYPDLKIFASYQDYVTIEPILAISPQSMQLGQKTADTLVAVGMGKLTVDQAITQLNQIQEKLKAAAKGGK